MEVEAYIAGMEEARAHSLRLIEDIGDAEARLQPDPEFSPIGWHLGHIAWQEERWLHRMVCDRAPLAPEYDSLFDSFRSQKKERSASLPPFEEIRDYASRVRDLSRSISFRGVDSELLDGGWVFRFLQEHECQHAETMALVRLLARLPLRLSFEQAPPTGADDGWFEFPAGSFLMGTDDISAWDNERPAHRVELPAFRLRSRPVTNGEWLEFMDAGGYEREEYWSPTGWAFIREKGIRAPLHWGPPSGSPTRFALSGWAPLALDHPVAHISCYEAEAFARFAGARLPTEAEWERAARTMESEPIADLGMRHGETSLARGDFFGKVWEWTASFFEPYPGFQPGPYRGYSQPWFGGKHRVLRGGSHLSHPTLARPSFRNWLEPHIRAYPSGLRLARSAD